MTLTDEMEVIAMTGIKIAFAVWLIAAIISIVVYIRGGDDFDDDLL